MISTGVITSYSIHYTKLYEPCSTGGHIGESAHHLDIDCVATADIEDSKFTKRCRVRYVDDQYPRADRLVDRYICKLANYLNTLASERSEGADLDGRNNFV